MKCTVKMKMEITRCDTEENRHKKLTVKCYLFETYHSCISLHLISMRKTTTTIIFFVFVLFWFFDSFRTSYIHDKKTLIYFAVYYEFDQMKSSIKLSIISMTRVKVPNEKKKMWLNQFSRWKMYVHVCEQVENIFVFLLRNERKQPNQNFYWVFRRMHFYFHFKKTSKDNEPNNWLSS